MTSYTTTVTFEFNEDLKLAKKERAELREGILKMLNSVGPFVDRSVDVRFIPHFTKCSPLERVEL